MPDSQQYQEKELLQRMVKGDMAAFENLYLQYFDLLLKQTQDITKNTAVAEDLVQEIFLRLWDKRADFVGYEKISGWLFVCSYHGALNYLKKSSREHQRNEEFIRLSDWMESGDRVNQEKLFNLMEKAIELLPPQRKKVFLLCKYKGVTYEQASSELSISKNTVKEHIVKASAFIREYMAQSSYQPLALITLLLVRDFFSGK